MDPSLLHKLHTHKPMHKVLDCTVLLSYSIDFFLKINILGIHIPYEPQCEKKPVFGGLRTTKVQTSLRIHPV